MLLVAKTYVSHHSAHELLTTLMLSYIPYIQADQSGLAELQAGGAVYLFGVFFFKSDGFIPLAHAIWHVHVVVGAIIHYQAVNKYLIHPGNIIK